MLRPYKTSTTQVVKGYKGGYAGNNNSRGRSYDTGNSYKIPRKRVRFNR